MSIRASSRFELSVSHDVEKDRYFIIDNKTGKAKRVNPCGQEFKIYDLNISGVAETKKRNILAGNVGDCYSEECTEV